MFLSVNFTIGQHNHEEPKNTNGAKAKSPHTSSMEMVGANHVHIDYSSPSVRGRNIWNGLVAYGQVWSTGAHKATWIEFSEDVMIANTKVEKGKYGFFTIPGKKEWVLILSKTWDMHLADDYKSESDVIRLNVKPKKNKTLVEALTYEVIAKDENKGKIKMSWENLNVSFDFQNMKTQ